ncbi:MAG: proton-conducting transporter membrane subunit [Anaerolineae bacterium]|nr:hypothetical protein [Thermoflexales bacterium]MDW8395181.1 proton-conducting transporter membrane subunit [Anaerolineae bacterium]
MITLPAVLLCAAGLLIAGVSALATNQRPWLSASIVALVSALLAGLIALPVGARLTLLGISLDFAQPFVVLGRAFVLSEVSRSSAAVVLASGAILLATAWRTPQGRYFVPLSAALIFFLFIALTVRPFAYAALAFQGAAVAGAILVQGNRAGSRSTLSSWRYLVSATLALAALFFAGWFADRAARTTAADPASAAAAYDVPTALMLIGFVLLLGALPLYSWIHPAVKDAPPLVSALLGAVVLGGTQLWTFEVWRELDWLQNDTVRSVLSTTGSLLLTLAALLGWAQRSFARALAAALFAEVGSGLLLVVTDSTRTAEALLLSTLARSISLSAFCLGLAVLDQSSATSAPTRLRLWALGAAVVGGLSLAGIPGTIGFVARWVTARGIGQTDLEGMLLILAAGASISIGVLRSAHQILSREVSSESQPAETPPEGDNLPLRLTLAVSIALTVLLGLWPSALVPLLGVSVPQ